MSRMTWRLASSGLLLLVLGLATGCWPFSTTETAVPSDIIKVHQKETELWVAFGHDADAYVEAMVQDIEAADPEADGAAYRANWAELRENYEDAMRMRAVMAAWMKTLEAFLEVSHGGN